jgi:Zn-dependent protease
LISYACLVPVISCHEFAHAWVADKCGDNTPRMQGRVTLNPLAHMDLIGTVILPLLSLYFTSMIFGWGRPVYVNPSNFRERRRDDTLVSLAGPGMNFLMAAIAIMVAKIGSSFGLESLLSAGISIAWISLLLAFFNLIPIPPLDGSHVVKNLILMKDETYLAISQYGMLLVIIAIQIPMLNHFLSLATIRTLSAMAAMVRLPI